MNGINIQAPWSDLLIGGQKTVETRSYPLPKKYEGVELALIETPGKHGKFKSRIIGTITFSHCFEYKTKKDWRSDYARHKVDLTSKFYWWNDKPKYGWVVSDIVKFDDPVDAPKNRGIVFTSNCITW